MINFAFYRQNAWWLGTGLLFTFGSSFGQTYFISFFAGGIRAEFDLSNGEWGSLYTAATVMSAITLMQLGKLADTVALSRLAVMVALAYALSALAMMVSVHWLMLAIGVFGLRFCGQGMMTHLAMTAMARWFRANRARAVAVAALGFPIGEAAFPLFVVGVLEVTGWRVGWGLVAVLIAGVLLPAAFLLTRHGRTPKGEGAGDAALGMGGRHWTRGEAVRNFAFWLLLPGILAPPFIGTCAFFHQVHIAEVRGYDLATMALAYPLYAAVSVGTALISGPIVDRLGPTRFLPFFLLPIAAAMVVLSRPGGVEIWFLMLMGIGFSQGVVVTLTGSLWPTLYGTRNIGAIKALGTAMMVFATAAGPGITGVFIDLGAPFPDQALFLAAYCAAVSVIYLALAPKLTRATENGIKTPLPAKTAGPQGPAQ